MLTSKRICYGLRILCDLATNAEGFQSAHTLAEAYQAPETFLRRILMDLRRAGFVEAQKGRIGGYKLARKPEEIKVGAVIRALEPEALELAYGQLKGRGAGVQPVEKSCPTWPLWNRLETRFREELEKATLADLLAASRKG
ncbi:MAG: Rrf2 family transcriptional regulator [Candidatus Bipolaricaulota bacterium]|nr:Rrf2 family transcriptional regulator [Candidatus Bipolaricaulota bacterium]MDW8127129.1 Rrf2 family transcriptional regulator [Candidatus Bipolaricaulota bacterium]